MHLGIVAEGPSDLILLERIAKRIDPECSVSHIQPEPTLGERGAGWKAVRAWCNEFGKDLELFMEADTSNPIDRLLIHVDCSMAHNVEARHPCPPSTDTANALCSAVLDWLHMDQRPQWLHIATPSSSSDTWLAAVLAPPEPDLGPIECIDQQDIEKQLISKRLFRRRSDGRMAKPGRKYEELAKKTVAQLEHLRETCHLADALCDELA